MKKKIMKSIEYDGLGFPVILLNVPVIEVRGAVVPDINYNQLQRDVLLELSKKPSPLTGNEVRFIRQYLDMTYIAFANQFGVTHASVIHWEKSQNAYAKIMPTTELCIRLIILETLHAKDKLFRQTFRNFDFSKIKPQNKVCSNQHITIDSTGCL